jgi:hypothetical protein
MWQQTTKAPSTPTTLTPAPLGVSQITIGDHRTLECRCRRNRHDVGQLGGSATKGLPTSIVLRFLSIFLEITNRNRAAIASIAGAHDPTVPCLLKQSPRLKKASL